MTTSTSTAAPVSGTRVTRLHGLDALRAVALGLGIVLHSLMPFLPYDLWPVLDVHRSDVATGTVMWIHLFRMVLFMALAGYFGRMVLQRRGPAAYLRDRSKRILLPLLVFGPITMAGMLAIIVAGLPAGTVEQVGGQAPPLWMLLISPVHLWFLGVLMQCVVITVAARAVLRRIVGADRLAAASSRIGGVLTAPGGVLLAAVPYLAALLLQGTVDGGITEPTTLIPELAPLIGYLGAFAVGWFLHARSDALARLARHWPAHLTVALPLTAVHLLVTGLPTAVAAAAAAVAGWAWAYALVGLAVRCLHRENAVLRYLADASYWVYVLHLVLLMAIQLPMTTLDWPIMLKLVVAWIATAVVTLGTYDLLVRGTWLGAWLNGHRRTPAWHALVRRRAAPQRVSTPRPTG